MVDLHHHLLPDLDDGSPDLDTSIAMARIAVMDGLTHIVCTPHANAKYAFSPQKVAQRLQTLRQAFKREDIPLTLGSGCDFHMSYDNIQDALIHPRKYTINATQYLLVELPDFGIMPNFGGTLYDFNVRDIVPILTHPERNSTLAHNPSLMAGWLRQGLLTQVTAGSLLGLMGKTAERAAHKLLENRWVHFIATDAHNARSRAPRMSAACDLIAKRYDSEYARRLCVDNPMAVFKGHILPAQEEPLHLDNEAVNTNSFRSRLQRLFRMS